MKNLFIILIITLFFTSCTFKKVENRHGVNYLNKKQEKLSVNISNKNDILKLLGTPSTKSTFDNDIWIYIEIKTNRSKLTSLAKEKIVLNNVLILEINNKGLLEKKDFLELKDMKDVDFSKQTTTSQYKKDTFIYDFLSSMRQKLNDPLGKRSKKN